MKFKAPRGTNDILPSEQPLWQLATATLAASASRNARSPSLNVPPPRRFTAWMTPICPWGDTSGTANSARVVAPVWRSTPP